MAYGNIDKSIAGLVQGLHKTQEGRFVAAEEIPFGAPVFGYIGEDIKVGNYHLDTGKLVYSADFVTDNVVDVMVDGEAITPVDFDTDHITTISLVVAAIAALEGVEAILDTTDVNNRTILYRKKFVDASISSVVTGGATQATAAATYFSSQVFMGISVFVQNAGGVYAQYDSVEILTDGQISVLTTANVRSWEAVYVDNSGADIGTWSNAGFEVAARYTETISAGTYTVIEVSGKSNETYAETF